jgi:Na+/H+-dicarboxylate symporter
MSPTNRVLVALILGFAAGLLVLSHPTPTLLATVRFVEPIGVLWVNAIRMTVVPLVVSLLITGIASTGDLRTVRTMGLRAIGSFLGLLALAAVVGLLVVPPMFAWLTIAPVSSAPPGTTATGPPTSQSLPGFVDWVVGLVPTNPLKAAVEGTMLPLVVFTLAFALALLTIGAERRQSLLTVFGGIGDAMLAIVRVVIAFAPVGVFALTLPLASRSGLAAAGALGYYVAAAAIAQTVATALLYPLARIAAGVPIRQFARAVFPAQAVAISSSSSLASLPALIDGANRILRLPAEVTGMVLPLAVASFKVAGPVLYVVAAVFLSRFYGVPLGPTDLLVVSLTSFLSSFTTPGVPHGWLLVVPPLVAAMGIPAEGVGLLIAVDAIPDIFATALNVTADMLSAAIVSRGR